MKNYRNEEIDLVALNILYKKDPLFRILIDFLARQDEDEEVLHVEDLEGRLNTADIKVGYPDALRMLKALDGRAVGWFYVGRKGAKSRFQFDAPSTVLAHAIIEGSEIIEMSHGDTKMIKHRLWIRPSVEITLELPFDLNEREVGRIGDFLKTLPFNWAGFKKAA